MDKARSENLVLSNLFHRITGGPRYEEAMNNLCNSWLALLPDVPLVDAKPDYFNGLVATSPQHKQLCDHIGKLIVPGKSLPILPNFFVEGKGSGGTLQITTRQALHDGTLGARAMYHTKLLAGEKNLNGYAYAFSATYVDGTLSLHAHFCSRIPGENTQLRHHMCRLARILLDETVEDLVRAITAFRNLQDLAHEIRTEAASVANQKLMALIKSGRGLPAMTVRTLQQGEIPN